jgi:hypothetical protein
VRKPVRRRPGLLRRSLYEGVEKYEGQHQTSNSSTTERLSDATPQNGCSRLSGAPRGAAAHVLVLPSRPTTTAAGAAVLLAPMRAAVLRRSRPLTSVCAVTLAPARLEQELVCCLRSCKAALRLGLSSRTCACSSLHVGVPSKSFAPVSCSNLLQRRANLQTQQTVRSDCLRIGHCFYGQLAPAAIYIISLHKLRFVIPYSHSVGLCVTRTLL